MDPKQNPKPLDPKLQEAYDRVMGVSLGNDPASVTAPIATPPTDATVTSNATPTSDPFVLPSNPVLSASPTPPNPTTPSSDPFSVNSPTMATPPVVNPAAPVQPITTTSLDPSAPIPSSPTATLPVDVSTPVQPVSVSPTDPSASTPTSTPVVPSVTPTESLSATIPLAHSSETVSIGNLTGNQVKSGEKKGISPVIILLGGIVFLVVYVLFWVKIFGLPIPFINQ